MRIASTQYHATMNTALQKANERLSDILQKMASGEKFSLPSEDPVGAVRLSRLTREEAALVQYRENIATLKGRLSQNEAFLDGMISDMTSARDLLVWALDGSNTAADINAMASSIQPIIDSLFYAANSRDAEGRYLFSGTLSDTAALTYDPAAALGARYTYTGNAGRQLVAVAAGVQQAANVTVQEMAAMLNQLDQVRAVLSAPGVSANDPVVRAELQAALNVTDQTLNVTAGKIAGLGGAQNILSTLDANHQNISLSNRQAALVVGQLDYADAAVKLNGYTTSVQATQKAYAQVSKLSLFEAM
ncbi:MAG: flagellar hook-associated protein FlgL [Steroidobacteraceae bacterium]|jgi:flagellar hook-associated protein 3 FlgL|nr:flagellar hook-associated protein FlgL [Steroidobacteraceae bacterium]